MKEPLKILSLGAGVQSTAVLLMSCKGELPKLDAAIFADTGWEPKEVYEHFEWLKAEAEKAGIPVYIVSIGDIRANHLKAKFRVSNSKEGRYQIDMPVFSKRGIDTGITTRQCTSEYKIKPVERKVRELLGYKKGQRIPPDSAQQWLGISTDEIRRAKISKVKWYDLHYPLLIDKRMSRADCLSWLEKNYPERKIPRSACIGCPFHSNEEWSRMKNEDPVSWEDAVDFDKKLRDLDAGKDKGLAGKLYLHSSCVPLSEVDFDTAEEKGQDPLWLSECSGMCGI